MDKTNLGKKNIGTKFVWEVEMVRIDWGRVMRAFWGMMLFCILVVIQIAN